MAARLVSDELWRVIESFVPKHQPSPRGGRPPVSDRTALTGILFVLRCGIPWEMLPAGGGLRQWHDLLEAAA
jgi:transposase